MRIRVICLFIVLMLGVFGCSPSGQSRQQALPQSKAPKAKVNNISNKSSILLGWNAFGTTDIYIEQNNASPEMNVVSPRWFSLDEERIVSGEADQRYIEWAHGAGRKVWAFFGNQFNAELTDKMIGKRDNHKKIAEMLKEKLVPAKIDGINVDFENINPKNKDDFVHFVKELKSTLGPHGIVISVDVTRENPDPFWSGSYDRKALGETADYIVMMGYDEDLGGGEKVGSVASLSWVEEGIRLLMKDVPSEKIILAIPFYTREWVTNLQTNQSIRFDRNMIETEQILMDKKLDKKYDPKTKQNYVEFVEKGEKHQIWVEDETSLQNRLDLVKKYNLRGSAVWYVGQEIPGIWTIFR